MLEVVQIGNVSKPSAWDNPSVGRVYDTDGISPTINTAGGGNRQPMIVVGDDDE